MRAGHLLSRAGDGGVAIPLSRSRALHTLCADVQISLTFERGDFGLAFGRSRKRH